MDGALFNARADGIEFGLYTVGDQLVKIMERGDFNINGRKIPIIDLLAGEPLMLNLVDNVVYRIVHLFQAGGQKDA